MNIIDGPRLSPASGAKTQALIVLLHGYGSNGDDLIGLAPYWKNKLAHAQFVAPNAPDRVAGAPIRVEPGRRAVPETFLSKSELRAALRSAGFHSASFRRICFYPAPETAGALGSYLARVHRRTDAATFRRYADRVLAILGLVERFRILNQKQMWVAVR